MERTYRVVLVTIAADEVYVHAGSASLPERKKECSPRRRREVERGLLTRKSGSPRKEEKKKTPTSRLSRRHTGEFASIEAGEETSILSECTLPRRRSSGKPKGLPQVCSCLLKEIRRRGHYRKPERCVPSGKGPPGRKRRLACQPEPLKLQRSTQHYSIYIAFFLVDQ